MKHSGSLPHTQVCVGAAAAGAVTICKSQEARVTTPYKSDIVIFRLKKCPEYPVKNIVFHSVFHCQHSKHVGDNYCVRQR